MQQYENPSHYWVDSTKTWMPRTDVHNARPQPTQVGRDYNPFTGAPLVNTQSVSGDGRYVCAGNKNAIKDPLTYLTGMYGDDYASAILLWYLHLHGKTNQSQTFVNWFTEHCAIQTIKKVSPKRVIPVISNIITRRIGDDEMTVGGSYTPTFTGFISNKNTLTFVDRTSLGDVGIKVVGVYKCHKHNLPLFVQKQLTDYENLSVHDVFEYVVEYDLSSWATYLPHGILLDEIDVAITTNEFVPIIDHVGKRMDGSVQVEYVYGDPDRHLGNIWVATGGEFVNMAPVNGLVEPGLWVTVDGQVISSFSIEEIRNGQCPFANTTRDRLTEQRTDNLAKANYELETARIKSLEQNLLDKERQRQADAIKLEKEMEAMKVKHANELALMNIKAEEAKAGQLVNKETRSIKKKELGVKKKEVEVKEKEVKHKAVIQKSSMVGDMLKTAGIVITGLLALLSGVGGLISVLR